MKNLITRALTGFIYVILLAGCTIYSPVSAFFFFGIVAAATLYEFGTVMNAHAGASLPRAVNSLAGFILVAAVWLHRQRHGSAYDGPVGAALIIYNGKRIVQGQSGLAS